MSWWGKLIGGTFGYMLGGPLGAVLGAAMGHNFDKGMRRLGADGRLGSGDQERVQAAFFAATFSVMGHMAKADGRVSPTEIAAAKAVMAHMSLSPEMKKAAIRLFDEGKKSDFPLEEALAQFRRECHRRRTLVQMFVEIQLQAAYADGQMHEAEWQLLLHICKQLGISSFEFERLDAMAQAAWQHARREGAEPSSKTTLTEAYAILSIDKDASDTEVKRAYRRLMSQHHPDKLVAKGLPEEMIELAKQKTQEIRKAYEEVKERRGMR